MLDRILEEVLQYSAVKDKLDISSTHAALGKEVAHHDPFGVHPPARIPIGDDCAAIPDGDGGYLLFAAEGIIPSFIAAAPWFAGYSAVMVNISDVCAMGGLPLAVTDVLWLNEAADGKEIWAGMMAASEAYGIPIAGGHTCYRSGSPHLAVSILGRAKHLLTSYDAAEGDVLLVAIDLDGQYYENYPFWNASTAASPGRLQKNMRLMSEVAGQRLAHAAKDISMGGLIGTLGMLLNTSGAGAHIYLEKIPIPDGVGWTKWLVSFPSFGYILAARPENAAAVQRLFRAAQISCEVIGGITASREIAVHYKEESITVHLK